MAGYEVLIWGIALFMGIHIAAGIYEIREKMVGVLGMPIFRIIHSVGSVLGFVLIVNGFSQNPKEDIYVLADWSQKAPIYLMPIALVFLVGSRPKSDISRITRHPMMWAVVLWSFAHLLANGDKASVMLFASFLIYGFFAMMLSDNKKSKSDPAEWERIKAHTSFIPFLALLQGRAEKPRHDHGLKAVIGGLFLYSLLLWFHGYFTGVSLIVL